MFFIHVQSSVLGKENTSRDELRLFKNLVMMGKATGIQQEESFIDDSVDKRWQQI